DDFPHPIWMRDSARRLSWVNAAYVRAVEAKDREEAVSRNIELLDHRQRAEAEACNARQEPYSRRAPAVIAGRRAMIDIFETSHESLSGGVAIDMTELAQLRDELQQQTKAHAMTLDQLPTAVAIFDSGQRLRFH